MINNNKKVGTESSFVDGGNYSRYPPPSLVVAEIFTNASKIYIKRKNTINHFNLWHKYFK